MGILEDITRKRKYGELRGRTKQLMLMRYDISQLKTFYNKYVNPEANVDGKRPVEEINMLTIAGDFLKSQSQSGRNFYINKLSEEVSFDEIISYSQKIKVSVADILKEYEERKALI